MLAEIATGFASLKAAKDIVQTLNAVHTEAAVGQVKVELQGLMLDAQQALFAAQEVQSSNAQRIRGLEAEIVRLKDWSAEKERYQLEDSGQGSVAYHLKPGMEHSEPDHWICPNCYQDGKKSMLKKETIPNGRARTLVCHACGLDIVTNGVRDQAPRAGGGGAGAADNLN